MKKSVFLAGLVLFSASAFASDWQATYFQAHKGQLLVDKDSIVDEKASSKKFWTVFAPMVNVGQGGEGYSYSKTLRSINCDARTYGIISTVYYDDQERAHEAEVQDKLMKDIVPDTENDYLWKYVCKGDRDGKLAAPAGSIEKWLAGQAKMNRENKELISRTQGK
ncbi:hypothetical protein LXA47_19410 [Massilia sp. P8910]|uniref:surface-adhesin E family protein n=1 Tax=Massilia antarctica TaxID=2765360 RepID=UPI001E308A0F|nr:surface-adhesin E family protein [Massilia antarctica]MCE3605756.1 hypothetical protein [Massilia antarctica]